MAETGGVVKRVMAKQLEPIKDDLEYIKKQVDAIRNRVDGLASQIMHACMQNKPKIDSCDR